MIPFQDRFEDVLRKAISGMGLCAKKLSKITGVNICRIEKLLKGEVDDLALGSVALPLGLCPKKLVDMAHNKWQPYVNLPHGITMLNTAFSESKSDIFTVNSYLIWSGKLAVAFDTGTLAGPLLAEIKRNGLKLQSIFITHTHRDHIAALEEIRAACPECILYCPKGELLPDSVPLLGGTRLHCERLLIEARNTPGHSPGALSYVVTVGEKKLAIVGDALFSLSIGKANISYQKALESVRSQILNLPDTTILCPGHGPVTTVASEKTHNPFF